MNTTILACGRHLKEASIDVINADGRLMKFGHIGPHVNECKYCKGANVTHIVTEDWDVQIIQWGKPLTYDEQRNIATELLGADR